MDFSLTDDQQAFIDLAGQILADGASPDRLRDLESGSGPRYDADLYAELGRAGLLGIAIPEAYGGAAQGFFELCGVIEQVGRTTAPVPVIETLVLGALPVSTFGSEALKQRLLPGVAEGRMVLTAALVEEGVDPLSPETRAESKGDGFVLRGSKINVPAAQLAAHILVPARMDDETIGVFAVDTAAAGVALHPIETTSGQPEADLVLDHVEVGADGRLVSSDENLDILIWMRERATAALCSLALGVCEEALRLTAEYTKSRKQFGAAIATFQAVGQRQADAYIDTETIRLSSWQAAWRLAEGLPSADAVAVAKYFAAFGGQRVVHTAVHQHGGMGVDRDYPLHRYFLYAKHLELALGGTSYQLRTIGKLLADGAI